MSLRTWIVSIVSCLILLLAGIVACSDFPEQHRYAVSSDGSFATKSRTLWIELPLLERFWGRDAQIMLWDDSGPIDPALKKGLMTTYQAEVVKRYPEHPLIFIVSTWNVRRAGHCLYLERKDGDEAYAYLNHDFTVREYDD